LRTLGIVLRVSILGSGDAFNGAGALHSCYLLEHERGAVMLECGPSVLASMKRAGIDTDLPDAVLVSHLHGDHFGGIPFLFLEYTFENKRTRPLTIVGPPTTKERVETLYEALYKDIHGCRKLEFEVEYVEARPGDELEVAGVEVEAFEVPHSAHPFSLGYRLSGGGGTLLFSGDSAWTDEFIRQSRDTDLFLCECCSLEAVIDVHISYAEMKQHRDELGCDRLVLTHLGAAVRDSDEVEIERAHDGMVIRIGD
jgi:ribonuclease BN (tRNA processing enzyme)